MNNFARQSGERGDLKAEPFRFLGVCFIAVSLTLVGGWRAQAQEAFGPDYSEVEQTAGFFPTYSDTLYGGGFGGQSGDYSRSGGGTVSSYGPDQTSITADGLWNYQDPEQNFYQRHPRLFRPVDSVFGLFASHELGVFESRDAHTGVIELDVAPPIGVTRHFDPERAHLKVGPAYFDLLFMGGGVLYSDYSGTPALKNDDGWIGILEMGVRGAARLTDSLYIATSVNLYYLPFEDQWGVDFTDGSGGASLRAGYEFQVAKWDWLLYDRFRAYSPFYDLFGDLDNGETDVAGRYRFGQSDHDSRGSEFFVEEALYFSNIVGAKGTAPVFADQWRLWVDAYRRDSWRTVDFVDHRESYHFDALLGFEGDAWFSPYARYSTSAYDNFDSLFHRAYVGAKGLLAENLQLQVEGGYLWSDTVSGSDLDSWLWRVSLQHSITRDTNHGISFGQDFAESVIGDVAVVDYVQYHMGHRIGPRLRGSVFAQYSEADILRPESGRRESLSAGAGLTGHPGDFTTVQLRAYYQQSEREAGPISGQSTYDRWVYRASVLQRIFSRTHGVAEYQFTDRAGDSSNFEEHLFKLGLRTYF